MYIVIKQDTLFEKSENYLISRNMLYYDPRICYII